MKNSSRAIFTVATPDYFAQAVTVLTSAQKHNRGLRAFLFLVTDLKIQKSFVHKGIKILYFDDYRIKNPRLMSVAFRYSVFQTCCALKPFVASQILLENTDIESLVYVDSDMLVFSDMSEIFDAVSSKGFLLTPHLTNPLKTLNDGYAPSESTILISGTYNMGLFAVRNSELGLSVLKWWQERTFFVCHRDFGRGYFDDQKWADLIPTNFDDVVIFRNLQYNVAYWNLHERNLSVSENSNKILVNGYPLVIFHFSGWNRKFPEVPSVHQNRLFAHGPTFKFIAEQYLKELTTNRVELYSRIVAPFDKFYNGLTIPHFLKDLFSKLPADVQNQFENPFENKGEGSFFKWCFDFDLGGISPIFLEIFNSRQDLISEFKNLNGKENRLKFLKWFVDHGHREIHLSHEWISILKITAISALAFLRKYSKFPSESQKRLPQIGNGINVVGYLASEKGVGQAARLTTEGLRAANCLTSGTVIYEHEQKTIMQQSLRHSVLTTSTFLTNIFVVPASNFLELEPQFTNLLMKNRINIGYWPWELARFPKKFEAAFQYFNEIWVLSNFSVESIRHHSPIPVICVPLPLNEDLKNYKKTNFDDPMFKFLTSFDFESSIERKNPMAVIASFKTAFPKNIKNVELVVKCSSVKKEYRSQLADLHKAIQGDSRIRLVEKSMDHKDYRNLQSQADCFVSLHRSEGFGLNVIECMSMGIPVISTNYSGTTDFLNSSNGFPVEYTLTEVSKNNPSYPAGEIWADPSIEHAAKQMKLVYESSEIRTEKAKTAFEYVWKNYSNAAVGKIMKNRINIQEKYFYEK